MASKAHRVVKGLVGGWAILLGVIVTGCAAPQYTYVANSGQNTYFKVPSGWRQISPAALKKAAGSSAGGGWVVGYEAGGKPTASDFLSFEDTQPFVFAEVATLNSTTSSEMSYDMLRDSVLPVTSTARQSAAAQTGYPLTGFTQLRDQLLTPGQGVHGVRETPRAALHSQLLQPRPDRDQRRDVVVYRQEPVMSKAQAATADEGLSPPGGRRPADARRTRKPLGSWDRVKFLLLLALLWFVLVWSVMADDPIVGFSDAARIEVRAGWWVFLLIGLELVRQVHFGISERSPGYHHFWTSRVFGGMERVSRRRLSNWTRFRLWRLAVWVFWIVVFAAVVSKFIHTSPILALIRAPGLIWHALPFVFQILVYALLIIVQFAALFWFMSRGGVDVYYPDDIKTRFTDVWGQDHVLER
ncbi:MAG: hypothetical protein ABSA53_29370, partial [Streptosporangiaceae bacterium]